MKWAGYCLWAMAVSTHPACSLGFKELVQRLTFQAVIEFPIIFTKINNLLYYLKALMGPRLPYSCLIYSVDRMIGLQTPKPEAQKLRAQKHCGEEERNQNKDTYHVQPNSRTKPENIPMLPRFPKVRCVGFGLWYVVFECVRKSDEKNEFAQAKNLRHSSQKNILG